MFSICLIIIRVKNLHTVHSDFMETLCICRFSVYSDDVQRDQKRLELVILTAFYLKVLFLIGIVFHAYSIFASTGKHGLLMPSRSVTSNNCSVKFHELML